MKECASPVAEPVLNGFADFLRRGFLVSEEQRAGISGT